LAGRKLVLDVVYCILSGGHTTDVKRRLKEHIWAQSEILLILQKAIKIGK
jgi:hypothetical protein